MGQRFIISENDRKEILSKYYGDSIINEQEKTTTNKVYSMIKNLPLVRKIEKSYDSDLKKHIMNLISMVPKLKNKQEEILSLAQDENLSSEELASKLNPEISKITKSGLNEQPISAANFAKSYLNNAPLPTKSSLVPPLWQIAVPTLIFLILFIRQIILNNRKNKNSNQPTTTNDDGPCNCSNSCGEYEVSFDNPNSGREGLAAKFRVIGCDCELYDYLIEDKSKPITICACDNEKDNIVSLGGEKINVRRIGDCKKPLNQQQKI
jgi:hypothetical protein